MRQLSYHQKGAIQTIIMFGLGGLLYRNYDLKTNPVASGYRDENGDLLTFEDTPSESPKTRKPGSSFIQRLGSVYQPNPWHFALVATGAIGYKTVRNVNKLMEVRFKDPTYQLLKPEVLKNKIFALKFLGTGLFALPLVTFGLIWWGKAGAEKFFKAFGSLGEEKADDVVRRLSLSSLGREGSLQNSSVGKELADFLRRMKDDGGVMKWDTRF